MTVSAPPIDDVLVIGAGATGLAASRALAQRGRRVTLLERASRVGGNLHSEREGPWQIEHGPNTVIMKPPLYTLLAELDLLDEAQPANAESRKRFVVLEGRPVALPMSALSALRSPLLGLGGWSRLLREPFVARGTKEEESLADFVTRRLGPRVLARMVDPFVSGVHAGDPARLSVQAAMPRLAALERESRSLLIGGLARLRRSRREPSTMPPAWRGRLVSFEGGLERIAERLQERLDASPNAQVVCDCEVTRVYRETRPEVRETRSDARETGPHESAAGQAAACWVAEDAHGRQWRGRQLLLALPAPAAASLLAPWDSALAEPLAAIAYPPVNAVALGFRAAQVGHPLDGFGMLIPRGERRRTLGALFVSTLFPGRAPEGHVLINAFIGGRQDPTAADGDDATQVARVLDDLRDLLDLRGDPVWHRVVRWSQAIPQYELGHAACLAALDAALRNHDGLHLVGSWRGGIAVGDCLENGRQLGEKLAATP